MPTHQLSVFGFDTATSINTGSVSSLPDTLGMFVSSTAHTQTAYGDLNIKARTDAGGFYGIGFFTASSNSTPALRLKIDSSGNLIAPSLFGSTASNPAVKYNATSGLIYYDTSSIRYKENVQDLPNSLEKVKALRPVTFDEKSSGDSCTGLIAEEVVVEIPDLVQLIDVEGYDTPQPNSVDYAKLSVYLLKAIQEQQEQIDALQSEIKTLKGE